VKKNDKVSRSKCKKDWFLVTQIEKIEVEKVLGKNIVSTFRQVESLTKINERKISQIMKETDSYSENGFKIEKMVLHNKNSKV
jgi:hypothetical protein